MAESCVCLSDASSGCTYIAAGPAQTEAMVPLATGIRDWLIVNNWQDGDIHFLLPI